jgi:hypothetical protein
MSTALPTRRNYAGNRKNIPQIFSHTPADFHTLQEYDEKIFIRLASLFVQVVLSQTASVAFESSTGVVINKNIYGHFTEHFGRRKHYGFYQN